MKLILLGAPGAGKGTQAEVICDHLHIPAISTGNIIREALKNETEMGLKAKSYMEAGTLVPDDVVIGIIQERLAKDDCKDGFILDGFPAPLSRHRHWMTWVWKSTESSTLKCPTKTSKRDCPAAVICESCGTSYHLLYKAPKNEGLCDRCGGKLITRKDDQPETIRDRLKVYHEQTEPLKDFYAQKGKLRTVIGQEEVADTTKLTLKALED